MSEYLKHQVFLTKAQYETLLEDGSITVGGVTHTYDKNNNYFVEEEEAPGAVLDPDEKSDGQTLVWDATESKWKAYTIPTYNGSTAGLVPVATQAEQNYFLRGDGTWYSSSVTIPIASSDTLGGILVSGQDGILVDDTGTLSLDSTNYATRSTAGLVKVGEDLYIDENGVLSSTDTIYDVVDTQTDGLAPAASATGDNARYLRGDSTWADLPIEFVGQDLILSNRTVSFDRTHEQAELNKKLDSTAMFADYDATAFYLVGDRVTYLSKMYICTQDTPSGAFDPEYWEAAQLDDMYQTKVTCSTIDIGVGADLATGALYFVYEE